MDVEGTRRLNDVDPQSRRYKILSVAPEAIMEVLLKWKQHSHIQLVDLGGLPDDVSVTGVHYSWKGRCFELMLYHPSFPEVPVGDVPPELNPRIMNYTWYVFPTPLK